MASIQSIIIRPERKATPLRVEKVEITNLGIRGDHYAKEEGARQVTLIACDDLAEVAAIVGFQGDAHLASRRNIMLDSLPEENLKGKIVGLGDDVILEITGYCTPCFRMEENFGEGAINAFSNRAGWVAKVIEGGSISVGDKFFLK
ncbi:MAG TPA: MOSC domain-containing protein [Saprospiraceae bacterium]|nr:MOSC domain-containing protein [Saprospiraceae bacterium]